MCMIYLQPFICHVLKCLRDFVHWRQLPRKNCGSHFAFGHRAFVMCFVMLRTALLLSYCTTALVTHKCHDIWMTQQYLLNFVGPEWNALCLQAFNFICDLSLSQSVRCYYYVLIFVGVCRILKPSREASSWISQSWFLVVCCLLFLTFSLYKAAI